MNMHVNRTAIFGLGILLSLFLTILPVQSEWAPDPRFELGEAGNFAVLNLGKLDAEEDGFGVLDLSATDIYGDVGLGLMGQLDFQGPSTIYGNFFIESRIQLPNVKDFVGTVTGDCITNTDAGLAALLAEEYRKCNVIKDEDLNLLPAVNAALEAAKTNASRPATHYLGRLKTSMTVYGNDEWNVIKLDSLDYSRSNAGAPLVLSLSSTDEDPLFVLNISGKFVLGPAARIEGVDPSRVLINIGPGTNPVQFASDTYIGGTLLSPDRKMGPLQGESGPIIGGYLKEISLLGGSKVNHTHGLAAYISANPNAVIGDAVTLSGESSTSPSGELDYQWYLDPPGGSDATLFYDDEAITGFLPDVEGEYKVTLQVCDPVPLEIECSEPATMAITAIDGSALTNLSLDISAEDVTVVRKQPIEYIFEILNEGDVTALNVELDAKLSMDVKAISVLSSTDCTTDLENGTVECALGALEAPAGSVVVRIEVIPKKAGTLTINGTVTSDNAIAVTDFEDTIVLK